MSIHMTGLARLGRDAEVRYTQNSDPVASLSLALEYGRKNGDGKRPTQWVDASLWGKRAEALEEYLLSGVQVYVVLKDVHIETFGRRDGGQGSKLVAEVVDIQFASGSSGNRRDSGQQRSEPRREARREAPSRGHDDRGGRGVSREKYQRDVQPAPRGDDPFDDDSPIPF